MKPEWNIHRFAELESTNTHLLRAAAAGAPAGTVVLADRQRAGRGRRGRAWIAPPGSSLLVSVLLRPGIAPDRLHLVTLAAALGLVDALEDVAGLRAGLRWPNDVMIGERKLAGVLAETDTPGTAGGSPPPVVVGVGCNLEWDEPPGALAGTATTCHLETGCAPDRDELLMAFLGHLGDEVADWDAVTTRYRPRLTTLGHGVRVSLDGEVIEGRAVDVDERGDLVIELSDDGRVVVSAGDVVHLRDR